jgi:hypothetical protein
MTLASIHIVNQLAAVPRHAEPTALHGMRQDYELPGN